MEDSTMMTIEFLRARLLSERSVSRTAKQRADELSKRVAELEEQLKTVTLQRKKAEKTTGEVLAILENSGISDCSNVLDSSSDQEQVLQESSQENNSNKEEEASVTSRPRETELELPGSEIEGSSLSGRTLSWKSCSHSPNSVKKKYSGEARRRQSSYVSTSGSSTKPRLGKSCRRIKRMDTRYRVDDSVHTSGASDSRSAKDEEQDDSLLLDAQENGVATGTVKFSIRFEKEGSENKEENVFQGLIPYSLENQRKETCIGLYVNGNQSDADMKNAIEKQAQLIGRYEAEEIAQREWEEKFREDGSCTPDSWEHGNQSDITEERDEIRGTAGPSDTIPSHGEAAKSQAEDASLSGNVVMETVPNGFLPATRLDMGCSHDQQSNHTQDNKSLTCLPEFSFSHKKNPGPKPKGKQKQDCMGTSSCVSCEHQSVQKVSSFHTGGGLHNLGTSRSLGRLDKKMQQETPNELGCVLEALQQAKLSLELELGGLPSSNQTRSMQRLTGTPLPAMNARNVMETPLGCAGLFRVPTDFQLEANIPQAGFLDLYSDSRLSLKKNYPELGIEVAASNRYLANPELEIGLRNFTPRPSVDLSLDMGMAPPCSNRFTYPSYANLMPKMPYQDKFSRPYPTTIGSEMSSAECFSIYRHQMRPNLHNIPY